MINGGGGGGGGRGTSSRLESPPAAIFFGLNGFAENLCKLQFGGRC